MVRQTTRDLLSYAEHQLLKIIKTSICPSQYGAPNDTGLAVVTIWLAAKSFPALSGFYSYGTYLLVPYRVEYKSDHIFSSITGRTYRKGTCLYLLINRDTSVQL